MSQAKSPMSSPDFAKIRPPRKLRSGLIQSGSKGEGTEDGGEDHPDDGGDNGDDAPMEEEEPPSPSRQAALAARRSPARCREESRLRRHRDTAGSQAAAQEQHRVGGREGTRARHGARQALAGAAAQAPPAEPGGRRAGASRARSREWRPRECARAGAAGAGGRVRRRKRAAGAVGVDRRRSLCRLNTGPYKLL